MPQAHSEWFRRIQWAETSSQVTRVGQEFLNTPVIGPAVAFAAINEQTQLRELPTRPEQIGELQHIVQQTCYGVTHKDLALRELEQLYVLEDRSTVSEFIERNRLRELLLEAGGPLNAAFGQAVVKKLTLLEDDEGFETLFCLALIPGDMHQAMLALKSFDERWWLARSRRVAGKLNFDLELV
jgi:hypothetical protein